MHRSSTSFQNTDRECDPSDLVCQDSVRKNPVCPDLVRNDLVRLTAFPTPYTPGLRHITAAKDVRRTLTSPRPQGVDTADMFRDTLIESGQRSKRNAWATVGSLAFPLFFLVTLVVAPFYFTDALPKREVVTMLYVPPAPAAASNITRLRVTASTHASIHTSIPDPVRKTQEAPPPPVDTMSGVVGGVPGGIVSGTSGVLSEVLRNTSSVPVLAKTPEPPKRMRVASGVAAANLIHDVAPIYPPAAGRERIEGTVVLVAMIGKDGTVQDVRVKSGLPLLAQAAIDAVKQWRYRPYLLNGEPVEIDSQITINFNLSRG
jgi:protein TonB